MRRFVTTALLAGALLVSGSALAKEPRTSRMRVSNSGRFAIRMLEFEPGKCRLEVLKDDQPHWALEQCLGNADDLYFISDDAEKVWVIRTIPEKGTSAARAKKGQKQFAPWTWAEVAALYDRGGKLLRSRKLHEFVRTPQALGNVRQLTRHFKWLEGVAGVPGNPPRLNKQGKVELDTVEPRAFQLDF